MSKIKASIKFHGNKTVGFVGYAWIETGSLTDHAIRIDTKYGDLDGMTVEGTTVPSFEDVPAEDVKNYILDDVRFIPA